jgi:hypothetical protein
MRSRSGMANHRDLALTIQIPVYPATPTRLGDETGNDKTNGWYANMRRALL